MSAGKRTKLVAAIPSKAQSNQGIRGVRNDTCSGGVSIRCRRRGHKLRRGWVLAMGGIALCKSLRSRSSSALYSFLLIIAVIPAAEASYAKYESRETSGASPHSKKFQEIPLRWRRTRLR